MDAVSRGVDEVIREARRPLREGLGTGCDATAVVGDRVNFWSCSPRTEGRPLNVDLARRPVPVRVAGGDLARRWTRCSATSSRTRPRGRRSASPCDRGRGRRRGDGVRRRARHAGRRAGAREQRRRLDRPRPGHRPPHGRGERRSAPHRALVRTAHGWSWSSDPPEPQHDYVLGVYLGVCAAMSVPLTLLGLLEREPSHGYDLKRDYDTFFGRGQAAAVRPGLRHARPAGPRRQGRGRRGRARRRARPQALRHHRRRASTEVETWLAEPVAPEPHLQTVLFAKVVLALMLGPRRRAVPRHPARRPPAADARADRAEAHRRPGRRAARRPRPVPPRGRPALDRPDRRPARRARARRCGHDRRSSRRATSSCPSAQTPALRGAERRRRRRARSSPSWARAARASRRCCTAWPASSCRDVGRGPRSTAARIDTLSETERSALRRDRFGFVFQFGQLVPELTAEENVALPLLLGGTRRAAALAEARHLVRPARPGRAGAAPLRRAVRRPGPAGRAGPRAWSPSPRCCSPTSRPARWTRSPASR